MPFQETVPSDSGFKSSILVIPKHFILFLNLRFVFTLKLWSRIVSLAFSFLPCSSKSVSITTSLFLSEISCTISAKGLLLIGIIYPIPRLLRVRRTFFPSTIIVISLSSSRTFSSSGIACQSFEFRVFKASIGSTAQWCLLCLYMIIPHGQGHFGSEVFNQPYKNFPLLEKILP